MVQEIKEAHIRKNSKMQFLSCQVDGNVRKSRVWRRLWSRSAAGPWDPSDGVRALEAPCLGPVATLGIRHRKISLKANTQEPNTMYTKVSFSIVKNSQQWRTASMLLINTVGITELSYMQ